MHSVQEIMSSKYRQQTPTADEKFNFELNSKVEINIANSLTIHEQNIKEISTEA